MTHGRQCTITCVCMYDICAHAFTNDFIYRYAIVCTYNIYIYIQTIIYIYIYIQTIIDIFLYIYIDIHKHRTYNYVCTYIYIYTFVKGSLVGETSVLRTFRLSGKELVKERVRQRKR